MATLDVVTLAEAKTRLGGSVAKVTDDDEIQAAITGLSRLFDRTFGAVVQRQITSEHVLVNRSCDDWADLWPVLASPAPTADVGTVEIIDPKFGQLRFSDASVSTVTYTAGRFADTASVADDFKEAMYVALRNWRQADHAAPFVPAGPDYPTPRSSFPTFAMPNAARLMLFEYTRPIGLA